MKNFFIYALIALFWPLQSMAGEPVRVTYGLYAGGFNVVDMVGTYTIEDGQYELGMDLETAGLLGKLAPWAGVINTSGKNLGVDSIPNNYQFANTWRDKTETTTFEFNDAGQLVTHIKKNGKRVETKDIKDEIYQNKPVDMLTALFRSMNNSTCETTQHALDGKRTFDMVFKSKGIETIKKSRHNVFQGEAEICEVEIVPVKGKWRDKPRGWMSIQNQAKGNGELPRLWFGKIHPDLPPVPVKFFIQTDYGGMVMNVKNIQL